jgi:predicted RNase H-like nuclease (RuvC/YqgF family)
MVPEISRLMQPSSSELEKDNQSPKFRSNYRGPASIPASNANKQILIESLEHKLDDASRVIRKLEHKLEELGDGFEMDNFQSIQLRTCREEMQRLRKLLEDNGIEE